MGMQRSEQRVQNVEVDWVCCLQEHTEASEPIPLFSLRPSVQKAVTRLTLHSSLSMKHL